MRGSNPLQINLTPLDGSGLVIELAGHLDESTADRLDDCFTEAAGTEGLPADIVIDMAKVTFVDSQGLSALVRNRRRTDRFVTIFLRAPGDHIRRLLEVTALDALFPVLSSAES